MAQDKWGDEKKEYDNTDRGVAFINERKEPGDKRPDYRGSGNFQGIYFEFGIWKKMTETKGEILSISFQEPYEKPPVPNSDNQTGYEKAKAQADKLKNKDTSDIDMSDIPF